MEMVTAVWLSHFGNILVFNRRDSTIDVCDSQKRALTHDWACRVFVWICLLLGGQLRLILSPVSAVRFFTPLFFCREICEFHINSET